MGDLEVGRLSSFVIGGRVELGEGDAKEFGVCSHDGNGPGDEPRESPNVAEWALRAGDWGLKPRSTLRVVGGVM